MKKRYIAGAAATLITAVVIVSAFAHLTKAKASGSGCVGQCAGCSGCSATANRNDLQKTYYINKKDQLLRGLDKNQQYFKNVLSAYYSEDQINVIEEETRKEYEKIIPEIPYIGGDENPMTEDLEQAGLAIAFYKVQKQHGRTVDETGRMIYKATETGLYSYPKWLLKLSGGKFFSSKYIQSLRDIAAKSQAKQYPGDWVTTFVEGDGKNFDYGFDHKECGIVKFFHAQGVDELTPYMCKMDFLYSQAFGEGLVRTSTLAEGRPVCDFRYKRE